jgi:hypothetical protein
MKERPINFNAAMVNAILQGGKTQTRRIMKPLPADDIAPAEFPNAYQQGWKSSLKNPYGKRTAHICPYGQPGDRLWVRESFQFLTEYNRCPTSQVPINSDILYVADRPDSLWDAKVRPPQFMPRWASRITLEIESVRVERLQDISEADCWKEGIEILDGYFDSETIKMSKKLKLPMEDARPFFACIWESIYGTGSWQSNPWVWAIEFKILEKDKA